MKKLDLDKFDHLVKDGVKFYPIADVVSEIIPGYNWEEVHMHEVKLMTLELDGVKKVYTDSGGITKILERSKPPLGGFDLLLKGIVGVPKPKK